jgi:hypothetical protein
MLFFKRIYVSLFTKQASKGKNSMIKKSILLLVVCLLSVVSKAQTEHLKFAGVPLTGTITEFQRQLLAKGFKQDMINKFEIEQLDGKLAPEGKRMYRGKYVNQKAKIKVFFDSKTKLVFKAQAYFTKLDENSAQIKLEYFKSLLASKYGAANMKEHDQSKELPGFLLTTGEGQIYGYVTKNSIFYSTYIQYTDSINEENHRHRMLNDL